MQTLSLIVDPDSYSQRRDFSSSLDVEHEGPALEEQKNDGPTVPDGHRVYAIGDVHGCDELLGTLLHQIEADNRERISAHTHVVFLGDLIDRGPCSNQVIERLRRYSPVGLRPIFLVGNHEEMLLRLLSDEHDLLQSWLQFGGAECLSSYGIDYALLSFMPASKAVSIIRRAIPTAHVNFLRNFSDTFRIGDYLLVHAGIRPGVPLADQLQSDLRWIREPFLGTIEDHGFVVVHGHTISNQIVVRPNRIGLDTGAYRSGILSAFGAEGKDRWFLQTGIL